MKLNVLGFGVRIIIIIPSFSLDAHVTVNGLTSFDFKFSFVILDLWPMLPVLLAQKTCFLFFNSKVASVYCEMCFLETTYEWILLFKPVLHFRILIIELRILIPKVICAEYMEVLFFR